jgi:hypothetical protein
MDGALVNPARGGSGSGDEEQADTGVRAGSSPRRRSGEAPLCWPILFDLHTFAAPAGTRRALTSNIMACARRPGALSGADNGRPRQSASDGLRRPRECVGASAEFEANSCPLPGHLSVLMIIVLFGGPRAFVHNARSVNKPMGTLERREQRARRRTGRLVARGPT